MGTEFLKPKVCFLLNYRPTKFQWSELQIGQKRSVYMPDKILGLVHWSSNLHVLQKFYLDISGTNADIYKR